MDILFSSHSEYYDKRWKDEDVSGISSDLERIDLVLRQVRKVVGHYPNPRIIDGGCGNGWIFLR